MESTQDIKLEVFPRTKTGKSAAYRARREGFIPGVIYGPSLKGGLPINLSPKNFRKVYLAKGKSAILSIDAKEGVAADVAGSKVLFTEIQTHHVRNEVTHVDLHQLDMNSPVRITVPLKFVGKAKGIVDGGIVSILNREVEIKALPANIPSHIDVDVSGLDVGDSLKIDELAKITGEDKYEYMYETSFALVSVVEPEEEKAATPAVDALAAGAAAPAAGAAAPAAAKKEDAKS
ncbi:50S ribosomal protein L25 [bacterium]|nr:50S ribosomal protein L25 [bacterium]